MSGYRHQQREVHEAPDFDTGDMPDRQTGAAGTQGPAAYKPEAAGVHRTGLEPEPEQGSGPGRELQRLQSCFHRRPGKT